MSAYMVFSVESGIYLQRIFGVRVEGIVIGTQDGVQHLYESRHDFVVVD
jgi:Xaa-Pro aminopeptidase